MLAASLLAARAAHAYPQWQFSSGTSRCSQCHFAPAGGGIVTGYARDAVGEELSTWEGDGSFLHGAIELPSKVAIQFDGRYAAMMHDAGNVEGPKFAHFPMQADLALRLALTEGLSFSGVAGYRGQARVANEQLGAGAAQPASVSRFISREHYFMYRPQVLGWYIRLGRFFAPYGLRLAEHYTYVRRDTGFNTLEESYNASFGVVKNSWEIHLTAFGPDFLRNMGARDKGLAAMLEWRVGDASALGLGTRIGLGEDVTRGMGGLFAKTYFEKAKLQLQGQLDGIHNTFAGGYTTDELVAFAGVTWFPVRGVWVTPFYERHQTDIRYKDTGTNGGGVQLSWFPYPHFEIVWLGRSQMPTGQKTTMTGLLFAHYYM